MKYTRGPWTAKRNYDFENGWYVDSPGDIVAAYTTCSEHGDDGLKEGDAKIMAASLDMYKMLKRLEFVDFNIGGGCPICFYAEHSEDCALNGLLHNIEGDE